VLPDAPGLLDTLTALPATPDSALVPVLDRLVTDGWVVDAHAEAEGKRSKAVQRPSVLVDTHAALAETVGRACTAARLRVASDARTATVRIVVSLGEPPRRVSDVLVRDDVPHVFVAVHPRAVRIGPMVDPGRTPCLRCVDAHLGERDPRRATVLHQLEQLG